MPNIWFNQKFSRRVFLALIFSLIASKIGATAPELNTTKCEWCWLGAVTNESIAIKAKLNNKAATGKNYIQIWYHQTPELDNSNQELNKEIATSLSDKVATFNLTELTENTLYYYVVIADGRRYPKEGTLQFKTVKVNQPYSFAIACSSCAGGTLRHYASSGVSNSKVFDTISQYQYQTDNGQSAHLAMFIHMGDLHYRNDFSFIGLKEKYLDDYRYNYDLVMNQNRQKNLYQNIPLAYIWDDHDYGFNDSDGSYNLKYTASEAYRERVPYYPLVEELDALEGKGAIYQSFIIGRVRFIMTDSRFHRDSPNASESDRTILGREQREWFFTQLQDAKQQQQNNREGLIIWVNSIPWIGSPDASTDSWNKFARERTLIANFIKENQIDKLLMLSGDAHMLALDDGKAGTANSYATGGGGSFPIIHAASLDSRSSYKGGAYNGAQYIVDSSVKNQNGAIPGKGQWGLLNFRDRGNKIEVEVELKRMENTLIAHTFTF